MIYLINIFAALFFTFFTFEVYGDLPQTALANVMSFLFWYTSLWLFSSVYNRSHFYKIPQVVALFLYYTKELLLASYNVAYDVITRTHYMKAGIIAFPLEAKTDLEITLLANFITLTPGSLTLDLSEDRSVLYIHETYIEDGDIEKYKKKLRNGFEKRILKITR